MGLFTEVKLGIWCLHLGNCNSKALIQQSTLGLSLSKLLHCLLVLLLGNFWCLQLGMHSQIYEMNGFITGNLLQP